MESTDLNSSNEFHYIRPTATEVMMAKEDPLNHTVLQTRKIWMAGLILQWFYDRSQTHRLKLKERILVLAISMLNCILTFHSKSNSVCSV